MNKLQEIREACIKANPEIMELKLGCEVKMLLGDWHGEIAYVEYQCGKCSKHKLYKNCNEDCYPDDAVTVVTNPEEEPIEWVLLNNGKDFEVLGRPIRLADVLLAIGNRGILKVNNLGGFSVFNDYIGGKAEWVDVAMPRWNLLKDDLTEQSPETIDFIHSLLTHSK